MSGLGAYGFNRVTKQYFLSLSRFLLMMSSLAFHIKKTLESQEIHDQKF